MWSDAALQKLIAAMQTEEFSLAFCMPRFPKSRRSAAFQLGIKMSKSASLAPSIGVFGRLSAAIDRLLLSSARIAIRNGDLPHFGL
jgi:hypothetical protein